MILAANTTQILVNLRILLMLNNLHAYIIPAGDAHYTEFVAECHQRRAFVSGFTGSAGTAIVTLTEALLWTDGRYYFQARNELDENWTLQEDGMPDTPSQTQWLIDNIPVNGNVGVDPALYSKAQWDNMAQELSTGNKNLIAVNENLVDQIWDSRPACSDRPIFNLEDRFSGKNSSEKVKEVRQAMSDNNAAVLVVAELDEVAWLLNLRGRDIPSSAIFFGYVILTDTTLDFFVNSVQISEAVQTILKENVPEIAIKPYDSVYTEIETIMTRNTTGNVWVNRNANYALVSRIPEDRLLVKLTPISLMKAIKNDVEVEGYRNALIRDAAALCEYFSWLEIEIEAGRTVTEISASNQLYSIRQNRSDLFLDQSFTTISATGLNGAIIHYMPTAESDSPLSKNEVYLCDSGALYFDGTTDITRTMHFGTPTPFEKQCFTRVLKGQINLVTATFPEKTVGHRLDSFARQALWAVGLDYNHGTGHGIGSFLNVHEGPFSIGSGYSANDPGLQANMFTSNEPGYYDEQEGFGIRLENIIKVASVNLTNNFQQRGFLGFEDLTFVPYQRKMIEFSILTEEEIEYLNNYQVKTRELVGEYLTSHPEFPQAAYDWLIKETLPIDRNDPTNPTPTVTNTSPGSSSSTPTSTNPTPTVTNTSPGSSSSTPTSSGNALIAAWKNLPLLLLITFSYVVTL